MAPHHVAHSTANRILGAITRTGPDPTTIHPIQRRRRSGAAAAAMAIEGVCTRGNGRVCVVGGAPQGGDAARGGWGVPLRQPPCLHHPSLHTRHHAIVPPLPCAACAARSLARSGGREGGEARVLARTRTQAHARPASCRWPLEHWRERCSQGVAGAGGVGVCAT